MFFARQRAPLRSAFTVLELLVVASTLLALVGLALPAVVATREASRRITCTNNMRQVGVSLQQYHEANLAIPEAWRPAERSTTVYGWVVLLLPFMDEGSLHSGLNRRAPLTAPTSDESRRTSLPRMLCPSDISEPTFPLYADVDDGEERAFPAASKSNSRQLLMLASLPTANYVGVFGTLEADDDFPAPIGDGAVIAGRRVRYADLRRGLSKTLLIGERTMAMVPSTWLGVDVRGEDATCRLVGSAITQPNCTVCDECEFASRHAGGANFVWADGHVGMVSAHIDSAQYQQIARRR